MLQIDDHSLSMIRNDFDLRTTTKSKETRNNTLQNEDARAQEFEALIRSDSNNIQDKFK